MLNRQVLSILLGPQNGENLIWIVECEEAFQKIKQYLGDIPVLAKLRAGEDLTLYLSVSENAVSGVLVRDEGTT